MRYFLFFALFFAVLWMSCRKEPLEFTNKTGVIDLNNSLNDPFNCRPADAKDFPTEGNTLPNRLVVNGRVRLPNGAFLAKAKLLLVNTTPRFLKTTITESDADGKFQFDVPVDTTLDNHYCVDITDTTRKLIALYNCAEHFAPQIGKIQNLNITTCEGADMLLKFNRVSDADSVIVRFIYVPSCKGVGSTVEYAKSSVANMLNVVGNRWRVLPNSDALIDVVRYKNGAKTTVSQKVRIDTPDKTVPIDL